MLWTAEFAQVWVALFLIITIATGYILSALEKLQKDDEDEE